MATDRLTCSACGHEGYDVSTRIVEVANPDRVTTVPTPRGPYTVPARFQAQLRCMDKEACRDRQDQPDNFAMGDTA